MKGKEFLFKLILTAVFSALCFALTYVRVPLPTGATVHLGNFACVLAGLLCGGIIGGVSGALGMGLNDIASGYQWNTFVRTFIVKFLLGFSVGCLFRILVKRPKATKITLYSLAGLFTAGFVLTLILYCNGDPITKDGVTTIGMKQFTITIGEAVKTMKMSVLVPVFTGVLAAVLLGVAIIMTLVSRGWKQKGQVYTAVATVSAISVLVNLVGEFFLRWLLNGILYGSDAAFAESVTKIPSNLITGVVTIVASTIIYVPLYIALSHAGFGKHLIPSVKEEESE